MIYYLLPNINIKIHKCIDCITTHEIPPIFISNSLSCYLYEIKNKIKLYEKDWNVYKKYTNPYEFINTIIPGKNKSVSRCKPLSRSYFKMIEIIHFLIYGGDFVIYPHPSTPKDSYKNNKKHAITTFHLAEGPGGFIEAIVNIRNNPEDQYYGMTIIDDHENNKLYSLPENRDKNLKVPGWKKSEHFLKSNPNVILVHGADGTGNILSMDNLLYCRSKYGNSMDLITGDGGFDFSVDFNNQEVTIASLLFAQVCYAICLQKQGGNFILKIFDCFMEHTIDILYILSALYEKVYITKPQTSRYANSEKYLICKNFIASNDSFIFLYLKRTFQKMLDNLDSLVDPPGESTASGLRPPVYIYRFLTIPISTYYLCKLEEYNAIFGQQQIENIFQTIVLIENKRTDDMPRECLFWWKKIADEGIRASELHSSEMESFPLKPLSHSSRNNTNYKIQNLINFNIKKCIQWCIKHEIHYYNNIE